MKKLPLVSFALVLVCGCAHTPREAGYDPYHRTVTFDSAPPGARIFIGYTAGDREPTAWDYLGTTPCTNKVPCDDEGFIDPPYRVKGFSKFVPPVAIVAAHHNGQTNRQTLHGATFWKTADKVPSAMFFELEK